MKNNNVGLFKIQYPDFQMKYKGETNVFTGIYHHSYFSGVENKRLFTHGRNENRWIDTNINNTVQFSIINSINIRILTKKIYISTTNMNIYMNFQLVNCQIIF